MTCRFLASLGSIIFKVDDGDASIGSYSIMKAVRWTSADVSASRRMAKPETRIDYRMLVLRAAVIDKTTLT
jgi:hypothetical protein